VLLGLGLEALGARIEGERAKKTEGNSYFPVTSVLDSKDYILFL
jgi:hypothetical protein